MASPSHQEAYLGLLVSSTRGQTEAGRTTVLPAARTKTTLQKIYQNEKAESYVPDEGTRKTPEKQLNEVEISNLPGKDFTIMIVKIIQDLGNRKEKMQEMFT